MNYNIIFFSGTGGTKLAAKKLKSALEHRDAFCELNEIGKHEFDPKNIDGDRLIIMYPVHAFGAPIPVYETIDKLVMVSEKSSKTAINEAVVISISAGGEVPTNNGCRIKAVRKLRAKGYDVIFEDMVMMPSNWTVKDSEEIVSGVLNVLDHKIQIIADILINSNGNTIPVMTRKMSSYSRIMAAIGTFSRRIGFPIMGKFYRASDACNSCSLCASQCPQQNINMVNGKPRFGWKCLVCMRCIYDCPMNAISAGPFNFMIIEGGYNIEEMVETAQKHLDKPLELSDKDFENHKAVSSYIKNINDHKSI